MTPRQRKYGQVVKDRTRRCTRRTPPPCSFRIIAFKARYPPVPLPWAVPLTNSAPVGGRARTVTWECGQVRHSSGRALARGHPTRHQPHSFALINVHLGACYFFVPLNRLLHSQYVQSAGHKDSDIIGVCRDLHPNTTGKGDSTQVEISLLISKPTEQGLQSDDIEKRKQGAILPDWPLDRECLLMPSVQLHHCLRVVVQHDPFVELRFEFGGLENRRQKLMVHPVEGLGLV